MNDYYVSVDRGNNSTGDGSAANPWKTIGKAVGGSQPAVDLGAGGARVFVEPGTYYEAVTLRLDPSAAAPLEIIGDCDGAGFLAGGYATPRTGVVDWSAWNNDTTLNYSPCLDGGDKSHVTLRRLKMIAGGGNCVSATTGASWSLLDSRFLAVANSLAAVGFGTTAAPVGPDLKLLVERCLFVAGANVNGLAITAAETASEYSLGSAIRNCGFIGGKAGVTLARAAATGLGSLATGLTLEHCTFLICTRTFLAYDGAAVPLSAPIVARGCAGYGGSIGAGHASQVAEDWNVFRVTGASSTIPPGAHSAPTSRPALDINDGILTGTPLRPFGTPTPGSPAGGFVADGPPPPVDLTGRARPEGFGSTAAAAGALERHDTGGRDAEHADAGSSACLALRGPGSLEVPIAVDAGAVTIAVKVRWDGNHGDATKPQAILLANPEIGVGGADMVVTAVSTGGTGDVPNEYETLTFPTVAPTGPGALMLRVVSRSTAAAGVAYFDSITTLS